MESSLLLTGWATGTWRSREGVIWGKKFVTAFGNTVKLCIDTLGYEFKHLTQTEQFCCGFPLFLPLRSLILRDRLGPPPPLSGR